MMTLLDQNLNGKVMRSFLNGLAFFTKELSPITDCSSLATTLHQSCPPLSCNAFVSMAPLRAILSRARNYTVLFQN